MQHNHTSRSAAQAKRPEQQLIKEDKSEMALTGHNFKLMAVAGVLIVIGFLLMLGSKTSAAGFEPDIFSVRRIVIGPALAFLGFVFMGLGIIHRHTKRK